VCGIHLTVPPIIGYCAVHDRAAIAAPPGMKHPEEIGEGGM